MCLASLATPLKGHSEALDIDGILCMTYPAGVFWAMDVADREDEGVDRSNPGVLGR
jgi:hypothetical protein